MRRHFDYGHLSHEDIDSVEYVGEEAVAIVELKFGSVKEIDLTTLQCRRLISNAEKLNVPAFLLVYYIMDKENNLMEEENTNSPAHVQFYCVPMNAMALHFVGEPQFLTEKSWVQILHQIRDPNSYMYNTIALFDDIVSSISEPKLLGYEWLHQTTIQEENSVN